MTVDAILIRFLLDNFDKLETWNSLLDKKMLTRPAALLLDAMIEHEDNNLDAIVASLMLKGITADQFHEVRALAEAVKEVEPNAVGDFADLLETLSEREIAARIAETADAVVSGFGSLDDIHKLLDQHVKRTEEVHAAEDAVLDITPVEALEDLYEKEGMPWATDFFNRNIGPLRKGTFTILSARPDTGKTTVLMYEAAHQLKAGNRVVWFNNEERDKKVYFRIVLSTLGVTKDEVQYDHSLLDDFEQYREQFKLVNARKIKPQEAELLIEEFQPDVVVFDQLYKMKGNQRIDMEAQRVHSLFIWAREVAANYDCAVLAAHLADAEAAGKVFPEQHMMYMGKTGPQAEADFIIMMGKDYEETSGFYRGLNIVKLKEIMPGCDAVMRTYIEIDPFTVSFKEVDNDNL